MSKSKEEEKGYPDQTEGGRRMRDEVDGVDIASRPEGDGQSNGRDQMD